MGTTVCILVIAVILVGGLLLTGWHIVAGILHLFFSILRALFNWPVILAILVILVFVWAVFLR